MTRSRCNHPTMTLWQTHQVHPSNIAARGHRSHHVVEEREMVQGVLVVLVVLQPREDRKEPHADGKEPHESDGGVLLIGSPTLP